MGTTQLVFPIGSEAREHEDKMQIDWDIEKVKDEIKDEYLLPHNIPWIIGFSGGKDSTLMLHLVVDSLLEIPFSRRTREVHVIVNDTLVESPFVINYVDAILTHLEKALDGLKLPFRVVKTIPELYNTFWVNLIGRGYPSPTRMFRWCTDRMKIRPTTKYILQQVNDNGEVILLLGVRRSESTARAKSAKRYDNGMRLNRHNDITGCLVFRPILEICTNAVWEFLALNRPPWGGSHQALVQLYRNAAGGECPVVIDPDTAPSCGSSSIRFGCWTCTVVEKDRSFRNSLEDDEEVAHLEPMADFRDWLKDFCYIRVNRMKTRRNGDSGLGPLTLDARKEVLSRLMNLETATGQNLISKNELDLIHYIWKEDEMFIALHQAKRLLNLMEEVNERA